MTSTTKAEHAAECKGVKVPPSPFLNDTRINRINEGRYEAQEIAGALYVVRPDDRVIEMGAGLGVCGAIVQVNAKPEAMMSFEANPNLIPHIENLYALNRIKSKINLKNEVLISDPDGPDQMDFFLKNSFLGSSLTDTPTRATRAVQVKTHRYEALRKRFRPSVLIMDIEGGELEFLRHADLTGIRAIIIEFHPEAYGISGMRECKNILRGLDFKQVTDLSTRTVWTVTRPVTPAQPALPPDPGQGWSRDIQELDDAIIVPPAAEGFVQKAGVLHADGSYCPQGALWRNRRELTELPDIPNAELPLRKGVWLWGGVLWAHFGHFLVESTARLWALEHLKEQIDGILFIPRRVKKGSEIEPFQRDFFRSLGIETAVASLATAERVERLLVPGQGVGLGAMISGTPEYRQMIRNRMGAQIAADGPENLYISRSLLPSGRGKIIGEQELGAHLEEAGYHIYHPQRHDLTHQIATYKAARKVIAAEGSALHMLAMVAHPDCKTAVIVRRPSGATTQIARQLEAFTGNKPLMAQHLLHSWRPSDTARKRLWHGEPNMAALRAELIETGFIPEKSRAWSQLDEETIRARLKGNFQKVT